MGLEQVFAASSEYVQNMQTLIAAHPPYCKHSAHELADEDPRAGGQAILNHISMPSN